MFMYLRYYVPPAAAWGFNSIGLRKAQDVGIHRKKLYEKDPNPKDELWKRALWIMVGLDREGSVDVGRSCAVREEEWVFPTRTNINSDMPLAWTLIPLLL
jgi:hypothetical protein